MVGPMSASGTETGRPPQGGGADEPAIVVRDLHKSFGDVQALCGVDFDVAHGIVLGLLGPNGAGKTTVVRILTTLLKPDRGEVRVAGFDALSQAAELRRH